MSIHRQRPNAFLGNGSVQQKRCILGADDHKFIKSSDCKLSNRTYRGGSRGGVLPVGACLVDDLETFYEKTQFFEDIGGVIRGSGMGLCFIGGVDFVMHGGVLGGVGAFNTLKNDFFAFTQSISNNPPQHPPTLECHLEKI